jgi:hypothetical protein
MTGRQLRRRVWLSFFCLALVPLSARAQTRPQASQLIYGRIVDDATRQPISQVAIDLLDVDGRRVQTVLSDSTGRFRFAPFAEGEYRLRAARIGYRTGESRSFRVLAGESINFDFYLSTTAVLLAPIEVKASTRAWAERYASAELLPFYERKEFFEKLGAGKFFTRAQVREYEGLPLTALLTTVAGVHMSGGNGVQMRGNCPPQFYLNGMPFRLDIGDNIDNLFSLADIEAIEVYKGAAQLPAEFGGTTGACGAIVLWSRRTR